MVILGEGHFTTRASEADLAGFEDLTDLVHVKGLGFLDGGFPQVDADVREHHGRTGDATFLLDAGDIGGLQPGHEVPDELFVRRRSDGLEVGPAPELAHELVGGEAAEFIFGDGEGDDRAVFGGEAGGGVFLEERDVGVAVERRDHAGVTAGGKLLDLSNDLLVISMAERSVFPGADNLPGLVLAQTATDVFDRHAFAQQILQQD